MRVAIVGSRKFPAMGEVRAYVGRLPPDTIVVSGAGEKKRKMLPRRWWGVDENAEDEAIKRGLTVVSYPADWIRFGKGAGFIRNTDIAENCDQLVAFWDGKSRGTLDTITKARRLGKPVIVAMWVEGKLVLGI